MPQFSLIEDYSLDIILLTHCHLDHLGALPVIAERNPNAHILTSLPSKLLAPRMLYNSHAVMKRQRDELGIKEYPLYTSSQIDALEKRLSPMPFDKPRIFDDKGESLEITFYQAGHVAGASGCSLTYKHRKIFFTGDVLFEKQRVISGANFPEQPCDTLVMETTRGNTELTPNYSREDEIERLRTTIVHTLEHEGSVLIPVFALGRMQELLTFFHEWNKANKLPKVPIFCSGLGISLVDTFDEISRKTGLIHFRRKILHELGVKPFRKRLKAGETPDEKAIYLVSSGMMTENTPSYTTAAALLGNHHNTVCFVGYCDPDTPGGKLLASQQNDNFLFEALDYNCPIRAHIEQFDLSGHANREELLSFAQKLDPRAVVLTHGDPEARDWFFDELIAYSPKTKIINPPPGIAIDV
ncbi:MAG: MBL fold metallo-hydrolase [Opitutales bacterium]|tara:strand:- start:2043 stop:3278 length:1236 start_codon:yes stop_codon:yes gene_type:complete